MLNALAKACWRASPVTRPVTCPLALPCPLPVDPSACTLLELLPTLVVEVDVGGEVGCGPRVGSGADGGG